MLEELRKARASGESPPEATGDALPCCRRAGTPGLHAGHSFFPRLGNAVIPSTETG